MDHNPGRESFLIKEQSRYIGGWQGQIRDHEDEHYFDHQLKQVVLKTIAALGASDFTLEVMVFEGSVILGGTVYSAASRDLIIKTVESVAGVKIVHNGLKVVAIVND